MCSLGEYRHNWSLRFEVLRNKNFPLDVHLTARGWNIQSGNALILRVCSACNLDCCPRPRGHIASTPPPNKHRPILKKAHTHPCRPLSWYDLSLLGGFGCKPTLCVCVRGTFGINVDSKISFLLLFLSDLLWSFEFLWQQEFSCKVKDKIWFSPSVIQSGICSKMLWCPSATVSSTTAVTWCTCHGLLL